MNSSCDKSEQASLVWKEDCASACEWDKSLSFQSIFRTLSTVDGDFNFEPEMNEDTICGTTRLPPHLLSLPMTSLIRSVRADRSINFMH